tara:strand:+ start:43 stop:243 length:201 start_codon:yes stop_codon:yes gene_type:complete
MNKLEVSQTQYWDYQISVIKCLVINHNFKVKDIAKFYNVASGTIGTILHRRGASLLRWRHENRGNK